MGRGKKREENLMAKIAALLEKPVEEVKEARAIYTEEEAILEGQSVLNYYNWRKRLTREKGESDRIWEARQRVWQYKTCDGCEEKFAYSYHYDGVKYCSLDCLKGALKKIGIQFHFARPLHLRYGYQVPGIVPSSALKAIESSLTASSEEPSENVETSHPNNLEVLPTANHQEISLPQQDTLTLPDNLSNTS